MTESLWVWVGFNLFVIAMLALDLGIFHRRAHAVTLREALGWSAVWIVLALAFNVLIYYWMGPKPALEFLTGYLIEKSLSVDNLFVFLLIFSYFAVPDKYQHKVLFWGILGALVMRAAFIAAGVTLIQRFYWVIYIFGIFLIVTGIRMAWKKDKKINPERNPIIRLFHRWFPITPGFEEDHFFVRRENQLHITPLFIVLIFIETTDLVFAVDSIPAILAITIDPFIVYTSNVFAILGLRALYFALAGVMERFYYLHYGLAAILVFVGAKMTMSHHYKMPTAVALGVVAAILTVTIVLSLIKSRPSPPKTDTGASHS